MPAIGSNATLLIDGKVYKVKTWDMGFNGKPPGNQPMGHVPPPPPPRRPANSGNILMAQSGRATAENVTMVQAAISLAQSSGISTDEAMRMLERAVQVPRTAAAVKPIQVPPGTDLSKPRKRKIELE